MRPYFEQGGIRIFHGRWEEVWPTLSIKHEEVDLLWADPPYGVKEKTERTTRTHKKGSPHRRHGAKGRTWPAIIGDDVPFAPDPLLKFPRSVLWGANHYADRLPPSPAWFFWDKKVDTTPDDNADGELAWTNLEDPARKFSFLWRGFMRASGGAAPLHPTEKPPELATWGFQRAKLKPGDLVFSPYMGSGPEARAAMDMGLRFIGCEVVEQYCEAAANRLRQQAFNLGV